jgi:RNA polymerase sigma-70 factor (ECF subfamily)
MLDSSAIRARVEEAKGGNVEAFGDVVLEFQGSIRGFIAMLGVGNDGVEDIAQEAFVEAFRVLNTYDLNRPFGPWLRGIARNRVRRWRDKTARDARVFDEKTVEYLLSCEIAEDACNEEETFQLEWLRQCLKTLPARAAEIVRLTYQERRKSADIARLLSSEPAAIRVTLGRIRMKLRECIESLHAAEGLR